MEFALKNDEKAILKLRGLYSKYGYRQFKMSKFEEYDLYTKNKDFLVSDSIITFNDTDGRLMALKPDVTLSIIKDSTDVDGSVKKVYYNENVYRVSKSTQSFKEIMQTGLECIGDIDSYIVCETLYLAAKSLSLISDDFVLDISNMDIISAAIDNLNLDGEGERKILKCISEKNIYGIKTVCSQCGADGKDTEMLVKIVSSYGDMRKVIKSLENLSFEKINPYIKELCEIADFFEGTNFGGKIRFDFSLVSDTNYYTSVVFKGFINSIPSSILSGGRYDGLMKRMNKNFGAIGFAVYLDLLELLSDDDGQYDVDAVVLYDKNVSSALLKKCIKELTDKNLSVSAQKIKPDNLKYKKLYKIYKGGLEKIG